MSSFVAELFRGKYSWQAPSLKRPRASLLALECLEDRSLMDASQALAVSDYATVAKPEIELAKDAAVSAETIADKTLGLVIVERIDVQETLGGHDSPSKDDQLFGPGGGLSGHTGEFGIIHQDGKVDASENVRPVSLVEGMRWADTFLGERWNGRGGIIDLGHGIDLILPGGGSIGDGKEDVSTDPTSETHVPTDDSYMKFFESQKQSEKCFGLEPYRHQDSSIIGSLSFPGYFGTFTLSYNSKGNVIAAKFTANKLPADDMGGGGDWAPIGMKGSTLRPISFIGGEVDPSEIEVLFSGISRYDGTNIAAETGGDDGAWEKESGTLSMEAAMKANFYTDPTPLAGAAATAQVQVDVAK